MALLVASGAGLWSAYADEKASPGQLETNTGTLHGVIDLPDGPGPFPALLFIAGSGSTDRGDSKGDCPL